MLMVYKKTLPIVIYLLFHLPVMRLGVLFSGGKDSVLAMDRASDFHEIACLVTVASSNPDSFMFHTPCIEHTAKQAEALCLPHVIVESPGEEEVEVGDMERALRIAVETHGIQGVVTGAIASAYQAARVQRVCHNIGLVCFNPLWLEDQKTVLMEILDKGYRVYIVGVSAYPLGEEFLGRLLDENAVSDLLTIGRTVGLNPAGEGGEIETFVAGGPLFKKSMSVTPGKKKYHNYHGVVEMNVEVLE